MALEHNLTADYVLGELTKHADVLRGFGVKKIGLFGSVARGEGKPDSDLDFLVELERHTADDYFGLLFFLEDHFHCEIDLVMVEVLRSEFAPQVMQEVFFVEGL